MNLKKLKSVKDDGKHFTVDHADHGTFRVPKKGLTKDTLKKVQALCKVGEVQNFAEGGDVLPADALPAPAVDPMDVPNPETGITPRQFGAATAKNPEYSLNDTTRMISAGLNPVPNIKDTDQVVGAVQTPAEAALPAQPAIAAPSATAPATPAPTPAPVAQAPTAPALPGTGGIFRALNAQGQAADDQAKAVAAEELEKKKVWENFQSQSETRQKAFDESMKAQQADYDRIRQGIEKQEINPNRMWNNMSTGNKVMSAIAMVLGGFASNGQNPALKIIDDAISRDIDSQKTELGKKQTLLADNLRKTGDLREAEQLTRAQMMAGVQGQLNVAAAKFGGDKAKAQAEIFKGQLAEKGARLQYDNALLRSQTAATQNQQAQIEAAYRRLHEGVGTPADEAIVGEKLAGMVVDTPTGRALAHNDESAKEYRKAQIEFTPIRDHIQRLATLGEQMKGSPNITQATRQKFEAERDATAAELGHLAGLARLTDPELEIFKKRIRNLNDPLQGYEGYKAGLQGITQELEDKFRAHSNAYLRRSTIKPVRSTNG
jgi:hypothetical protein